MTKCLFVLSLGAKRKIALGFEIDLKKCSPSKKSISGICYPDCLKVN